MKIVIAVSTNEGNKAMSTTISKEAYETDLEIVIDYGAIRMGQQIEVYVKLHGELYRGVIDKL